MELASTNLSQTVISSKIKHAPNVFAFTHEGVAMLSGVLRITTSLCAKLLNISNDTSLRELTKLKSLNIIEIKGVGKGTYYILKMR